MTPAYAPGGRNIGMCVAGSAALELLATGTIAAVNGMLSTSPEPMADAQL
jgi:hypothetical protein